MRGAKEERAVLAQGEGNRRRGKRGGRALKWALSLALLAAVALGFGWNATLARARQGAARATELETMLLAARAELSRANLTIGGWQGEREALVAQVAEAQALTAQMTLLQERAALSDSEVTRLTDLSDAREERASQLSRANAALEESLRLAKERAAKAERERLAALDALTASEEDLAGARALLTETQSALDDAKAHALRLTKRATAGEEQLENAYALLTQAEEDRAGLSALLMESDGEVTLARQMALSRYHEAETAGQAARARQEELERAQAERDAALAQAEEMREKRDEALAQVEVMQAARDAAVMQMEDMRAGQDTIMTREDMYAGQDAATAQAERLRAEREKALANGALFADDSEAFAYAWRSAFAPNAPVSAERIPAPSADLVAAEQLSPPLAESLPEWAIETDD